MPKYKLYADATRHEGVRYVKGDEIELDEKVGKRLEEQGLVGPVDSDVPQEAGPGTLATAGQLPIAAERSTTGASQVRLAEGEDPRTRSRVSSAGVVAAAAEGGVTSTVPNVEQATGEEVPRPKAKTAKADTSAEADTGERATRKR
jgi:hypothetical protein